MSDVEVHGPIDFILLEFTGDGLQGGKTVAAVRDLLDRGIVRLYDLAVVRKDADGSVTGLEITAGPFAEFAGAQSGLLGDDDIAEAGAALDADSTAVLLVFENSWAIPFVAAALEEGGSPVASARIPALDVIAALDALDAASA